MNIALLEDDLAQAELVQHWLTLAGMSCVHYATGAAFRAGIVQDTIDLILIDWTLPDDDGLSILVWLRETLNHAAPVMFVTARAEEASVVLALDKGADDYLIKPLRRAETVARVNALLRRRERSTTVSLGHVHIDLDKHRATVNGKVVDLTSRELQLAVHLLRNQGQLLTRQNIHEQIWPGAVVAPRAVDTLMSRMRAKLWLTPENGFELSTVYHKGYRLEYRKPNDA